MERKLTAILSADVEGYSRLMGEDEEATVRTLNTYREAMSRLIEEHQGRVIDSPGDNLLAEFTSAVNAVQCAAVIQGELRARNAAIPEERRMNFRIGVNLGDVIVDGERIYGDGVNVAARVESLAEGGGISVSGTVYDQVANKLSFAFENLGEHIVKNIADPVRVYAVRWDVEKTSTGIDKPSRRGVWIAAVVIMVVFAVIGLGVVFWDKGKSLEKPTVEETTSPTLSETPSIAVLPFIDLSPEKDQEYFSDGIAEELLNAFTKIAGLRVAARTSSFRFKVKDLDISSIGEQLNVTTVLEGSVRKDGNNLRITAQLINVADGFNIWTETYNREMKNIFAIQDEISQAIVKALHVELIGEEGASLIKALTENVAAYDLYLKGRFFWLQRGEGISKSIKYFEQAIKEDPNFALAYTGLGDAYTLLGIYNYLPRNQVLPKAKQMLLKALKLEPDLDEAHASMGLFLWVDSNWFITDSVEREFERSIELNPNLITPHTWYSYYLAVIGRFEEAKIEAAYALKIDPLYFRTHVLYGIIMYNQKEFTKAEEYLKTAIELKPDYSYPYFYLGLLFIHQKRYVEGISVYEKAMSLIGNGPGLLDGTGLHLGWAYAKSGDQERANEILSDLNEKAKSEYVSPVEIGLIYLGLDEMDNALTWVTRAVEDHDNNALVLMNDPIFDPIRSDPRYTKLLRKMGLEE